MNAHSASADAPNLLTAGQAAAAIRDGSLTSEALVRACLERIDARDATLRAWAHLDTERALAEARERDQQQPVGPLHGVPVGIKDIIDVAGWPVECGTPIRSGRVAETDAACVARLREAGAVVLGKTVTTEFALFHPAPTRNPHDPARTPGGSSSGSAAAVADHHVPLALGTQTAGSVIRPAAFCGIVGYKPTIGAVPRDGVQLISPTLDTVGVLARTVADAALAGGVLAGREAAPADAPDVPPRLGFCRTPEWAAVAAPVRELLEALTGRLAASGDVTEVDLDVVLEGVVTAQMCIMAREATEQLAAERASHAEQLSDALRAYLDDGDAIDDDAVAEATAVAERARDALPEGLDDREALLAPCVRGEAPPLEEGTGDPLLCRAWTLLGTPAVAVPAVRGPQGLPVGTQVVGRLGDDARVLRAAAWLEARVGEETRAR